MDQDFQPERRKFLKQFVQYSALGLSVVSTPIFGNFWQKSEAQDRPGVKTNVVRLGYQSAGDIVKIRGVLEARLRSLGVSVQWARFPAGPQLLEAMNVGRVDIGSVGETPPIFAQAAGAPLVYIAGRKPSQGEGSAIVVRKNSPLQKLADLKGQKVIFQRGSASQYLLLSALQEAGLSVRDIQPISLTPAEARDAFIHEKIDAWVAWDPHYAFVQRTVGARTLKNAAGIATQGGFYLSRRDFALQNPELVRVILEEIDRLGEWAEAHPTEVARLLQPELKLDLAILEEVTHRRTFQLRPLTPDLINEQQRIADVFASEGIIPRQIAIRDALLTPQQYAAITPQRIASQI